MTPPLSKYDTLEEEVRIIKEEEEKRSVIKSKISSEKTSASPQQKWDKEREKALGKAREELKQKGYSENQAFSFSENLLKEYRSKLHFLDPSFPKYNGDIERALEDFQNKEKPQFVKCSSCEEIISYSQKTCSSCLEKTQEFLLQKEKRERDEKAKQEIVKERQIFQAKELLKTSSGREEFFEYLEFHRIPKVLRNKDITKMTWMIEREKGSS